MQTGAFKPLNIILPFSTHPLSSQTPWTCPIPALIILGRHYQVTSLFPPLDCDLHESRAQAGLVTAVPSTNHT